MERLKTLFKGAGSSETVTPQGGELKAATSSSTVTNANSGKLQTQSTSASTAAEAPKPSTAEPGKAAASGAIELGVEPSLGERLADMGLAVRRSVLKVVPLAEDDCLSCKLTGTAVAWGAGVFVLATARRGRLQRQGVQRLAFTLFCTSFATGLFLLGTARLFDLSLFQRNPDGSYKSINQLLKEDMENFEKMVSKFEPSSPESEKKT